MTIQEIVYNFKLQAEKIDTSKTKGLGLAKIIIVLNSGMLNLVKDKYGINNPYRKGFDTIQKRKQDLQRLHVITEPLIKPSSSSLDKAIFDISTTTNEILFITRVSFLATRGNCNSVKMNGIDVQTDDYNNTLVSPNTDPSFDWRETTYRLAEDKIVADKTDFEIDALQIDYLRYPVLMDIVGYTHFDGSKSSNTECELPKYIHSEIIDQAVLEFKLWTENPNFQFAKARQNMNE